MTTKRLLSAALALVLGAGLLSGCAKGEGTSSSGASSQGSASSAQEETIDLSQVKDPYLTAAGIPGDTVVAKVGEYDITAGELLYRLNARVEQYLYQYQSMGFSLTELPWDMDIEGETLEAVIMEDALQTAAWFRLAPELGAEEGLELSQEELDYPNQVVEAFTQELGSEELMHHYLWYQMVTQEVFIRLCQAGSMHQMLQDKYFGEDSGNYPTDAEAAAYAQDELGCYRAKHILLRTVDEETREPLEEAVIAQKKATAEELLSQLRAAQDPVALFDQLMNQYSEGPGLATAPDGYDTYKGQMVPEFENAALALKDGEISDIVESEWGYHIILRLPLELDQFRSELAAVRMQEKVDKWLEDYPVQTTGELEKIDLPSFRAKVVLIQNAVSQEWQGLDSTGSSAGSGGSSASGSGGGSAAGAGSQGS